FEAEDGIRDDLVTGVQTCALPIFELLSGPRPRVAIREDVVVAAQLHGEAKLLLMHSVGQRRGDVVERSEPNISASKEQGVVLSRSEERRVGKGLVGGV